jgi:hypothetical protein
MLACPGLRSKARSVRRSASRTRTRVGIVRDAICALAVRDHAPQEFHLSVVAETYDGWLSDIQSFPLETETTTSPHQMP